LETVIMKVGGMTCEGCASSVTRVLQAVRGVRAVDVSLERAQAKVDFDPSLASREELRAAVDDAGYDASF
jgi:copper chaperone